MAAKSAACVMVTQEHLTYEQKVHIAFWCKDKAQAEECHKALRRHAPGYVYCEIPEKKSHFVVHFVEKQGYDLETNWLALQWIMADLPFDGSRVPDGVHLPHYEYVYSGPGEVCEETTNHMAKREQERQAAEQ
ncbi:uncharacterized protein J7T54_001301 [Emericellopsis cladophorae]|uniref:Uncharacterized protein n=1 Tax=Emericellopsis cladophorae TaxID=2686198 RepID=A0A9P9Y3V2_9HYPO|nr:uncharacterized protein J7T54_001301 [Emericellopsis cladophorae]KAI6782444.1 hypothetical protein J7T54_001301 [Emericellopsis cladophorae]